MLDDIGVGQAIFLLTGLPPFLRCKELRPKDRGDLPLGYTCYTIGKKKRGTKNGPRTQGLRGTSKGLQGGMGQSWCT